ncbi:MAG: response regulator, partial [Verrucomicrobiales bacterium]|nr:response regulator [Verrucomicrobiales bacterium]
RREDRFCQQTHPLLLVEDDEVDVLSIERALSQLRVRFPIETKRNGEEALDWLRSSPSSRPFLILLDVNMPRMNGHEFLAELRKDPELRGIPVIVFTTSTLDADRKRMYDTGVTGFMVKPTRTDEFTQMFRALAEFWGFNSPPSPSAPAGIPAVANVEAGRVAAPASRN